MTRGMQGLLAFLFLSTCGFVHAGSEAPGTDPLAAIDLHRGAIIADIVQGMRSQAAEASPGATLKARLEKLRADRLLAASLTSSRESLEAILKEGEASRDAALRRASMKALGDPNRDLLYTPLAPCRLIDTRGFGAPIQGGAFAPNERRSYAPNGLCGLPTTGVASVLLSFTTDNLTPGSGGNLSILAPAAAATATVGVFDLQTVWAAASTVVTTGSAAQFDVLVITASAHVVVDILGYFAPPQGGAVTSVTAGTGLTGGTITSSGTIGLAATNLLPTVACAANQIPKWNGSAWACAADNDTNSGGTVTSVGASAPLASSGGTAPNISLTGTIAVTNGGTGATTLPANGILYGQGTGAVGSAVGVAGQLLAGTAGAPSWTGSPSLSGNLDLVNSTATAGNITKAGVRFIHDAGIHNIFAGFNAGNLTTVSTANVGIGAFALLGLTSGFSNSAVGNDALANNTAGIRNTAIGDTALAGNTTGSFNTASGENALSGNITGSSNIAIGYSAGSNHNGDNNIHIAHIGVVGDSGFIRIGTSGTHVKTYVAGIRGVTTGFADAISVLIDSQGQLGTVSSSRRFKDDITDMDAASSALMKLRPVTFRYKTDRNPSGRRLQYGLIAEEVAEVYPGLIARSADGQVETVMYQFLPSMLLNEYQKQQRTIEVQATEMTRQAAELRLQIAEIARQKEIIAELKRDRRLQNARLDALERRSIGHTARMDADAQ